MDIGHYLKEDSEVVDGSLGDSVAVKQNCIKIYRQYYEVVSTDRELGLALKKAFKGKNTLYSVPDYETLVWLCLSTEGYKVCSANLNSVSNDDISEAWQFIDTISVSSTKRCREMISLGKNNRSGVGFLRSCSDTMRHKVKARPNRNRVSLRGPPALLPVSEQCRTEHNTIEDAMVEDCMKWILESGDPVHSAVTLRSNILGSAKGV